MSRSEPEDIVSVSMTNLGIEGIEDIEQIGSGGSSRVYRARQTDLDRVVAIKVIHADHSNDVARRFDRERKAMGRLSLHEGIVPVYTSGITAHGEPYLIMPFFSNGSLQDQIDMGAMAWETAVGYVATAAETIAAAHDEDVVHLDLKPANILLTKSGAPRIADFGIAKLGGNVNQTNGSSTAAAFTPAYSAPETFLDGETGPPSDVYGLGATLWALLVGHPPFLTPGEDTNLMAVIGRVVNNPVSDLRHFTPAPICDVIERAMAKHPQNRYQTAREFGQALATATSQARSGAGQDAISTTGTSLFPEDVSNQTQSFRALSEPQPRPVAGSVQYVPPLNPTPAPEQPSKRLLDTSADSYGSPPGPTPVVHKEPFVDWDQFRAAPIILLGLVALALIGGLSYWALTRAETSETEAALTGGTVATAPEAPQISPGSSTETSSGVASGSLTTSTDESGSTLSSDAEVTATTTDDGSATGDSTDSMSSTTDSSDPTASTTGTSSSSTTPTTPSTPNPPADPRARNRDDGSVELLWDAPTGTPATAYEIFRNETKLTTVQRATNYVDTTVEPGNQYTYRLRSVGATPDIVSERTSAIAISVPDNKPQTPDVPSNPKFNTATNGSVSISWDAPTGLTPRGYEIFRDGKSLTTIRSGTSYTDTTTRPGQTYSYQLRSLGVGDDNASAKTQAFEIEIPTPEPVAPQPPTDLGHRLLSNGNVTLQWEAPTAGPRPTSYEVFRNGARLASVSTGQTYSDVTTVDGQTYTYSVRSLGSSNTASARTPTVSVEIPSPEPKLTVTSTPGEITSKSYSLELAANACSSFRVSWTDTKGTTDVIERTPATGCAKTADVTITGLAPASVYRISVIAKSEGGQDARAPFDTITTKS